MVIGGSRLRNLVGGHSPSVTMCGQGNGGRKSPSGVHGFTLSGYPVGVFVVIGGRESGDEIPQKPVEPIP